jgi:hypothetical protein
MTPRALAVACVVMIWCAPLARAQRGADSPQLIEWSADRKLTIEDFTAKVPARTTSASLSWVAIEVSWECVDGSAASRARSVFDPSRSWWRQSGGDGDRALLAHERLHFDLTELWARRIRAALQALPAACRTSGNAHELDAAVEELEHKWLVEQKQYDKETANGFDAATQKAWSKRIGEALREL